MVSRHRIAAFHAYLSLIINVVGLIAKDHYSLPSLAAAHNIKRPQGHITHFVAFIGVSPLQTCCRKSVEPLYAVPKKKPSKRRTKIRKTAWMKRFPINWKQPMMLDMFDVVKYTDGTLTKARTTHESWLNLPDTSLEGNHFLTKEVRPRW